MKNLIRNVLHRSGLFEYLRLRIDSLKLPAGATVLIHVGKCGGRTVRNGLKNAVRNSDVYEVHVRKILYRNDLKYIIIARNPISRLKSAFRSRYMVVVTNGTQRDRFKGEYEVLVKYGSLNRLAEALYNDDGTANKIAQQEIRRIHHIREDISFYLHDLLLRCSPNQIIGVLMQENLNDDILRVFGYKNELYEHRNPDLKKESELSETGLKNLMKFFREDYEILVKLFCWGKIEREVFIKANMMKA